MAEYPPSYDEAYALEDAWSPMIYLDPCGNEHEPCCSNGYTSQGEWCEDGLALRERLGSAPPDGVKQACRLTEL
ncbi:MAG: hypothetical protein DIU78_021070 [Pseudomonadota bacterium]|nr:MAG: hypothetical protein DIU78_12305 [Pseudomonadota bacterium]